MALARLDELNSLCEDPDLWNDQEKAQSIMQERTRLADKIDLVKSIQVATSENAELIAMAEEEGDDAMVTEAEEQLSKIQAQAAKMQLQSLLSGEVDGNDAYLEVHAGSGGTEAQDWASMLFRMYTRWAEQHGHKVTLMERSEGEEAGIKSATIQIEGENAYGWLKTENGVHRLESGLSQI